jgi:hypothetical protein
MVSGMDHVVSDPAAVFPREYRPSKSALVSQFFPKTTTDEVGAISVTHHVKLFPIISASPLSDDRPIVYCFKRPRIRNMERRAHTDARPRPAGWAIAPKHNRTGQQGLRRQA